MYLLQSYFERTREKLIAQCTHRLGRESVFVCLYFIKRVEYGVPGAKLKFVRS